MRRLLGIALLLGIGLAPQLAAGQILSPGELAAPHAPLDSLTKCTKCHGGSQRVSPERCYACHLEVGRRAQDGRGLHGRIEGKTCQQCHKDHRGLRATLIEWGGARLLFDHRRSGWPLTGAHAKKEVECEACHDKRRVHDADIKALLRKTKKRRTYLGLSRACKSCHFDEHRGQVGLDCAKCHETAAFKTTPAFDHGKTKYPLRGKHGQVTCAKCHPREEDERTATASFPAPKGPTFLRFAPLSFQRCTDCHKDPHQRKFGARCTDCHTNKGWKDLKAEVRGRDFHAKSRFPLEGAHASAPCAGCHGPFVGQRKARFKGIPFETCESCHPDGHQGQLAAKKKACADCHDVQGFKPARFELAEHQRTRFLLEGGHRAAPCDGCHPRDPDLARAVKPAITRRMKRERRPLLQSELRLRVPEKKSDRCADCHADPHGGQFRKLQKEKGCEGCHLVASFRKLTFDHEKQSRFARQGKHLKATCEQCHFETRGRKGKTYQVYRSGRLLCADCHTDVHFGQMSRKTPRGCEACHDSVDFKKARFDHNDPSFTDYALVGKHEQVKCEACHPPVTVGKRKSRRYRPLPRACEACHQDQHKGKFDQLFTTSEKGTERGCAVCHTVRGWQGALFDHGRTGWPLQGGHQAASCRGCHLQSFDAPLPRRCGECHQDPHLGRLGGECVKCHQESDWRSDFGPEAHRATAFPLTGRHAHLPCQECHFEARDRTFTAVERECVACHQADFLRTGGTTIDHTVAGFSTDCVRCHTPSRFRGATFPEHDGCFLISRGPHGRLRCADCHSSLEGLRPTGACLTRNATCTGCHEHSREETDPEHPNVPGYQYQDRKCFECHRISG